MSGFTLIEMIGVMAVMAILAGMILPNVIQQINRAVEEEEVGSLKSLAKGLEAAVLVNRTIPGNATATWSTFISQQVSIPLANIVTEQERGCARRYWIDPASTLVDTDASGDYEQDLDAIPIVIPTNVRAMLIADLSSGCGNTIATPATAALFTATWDQTGAAGSLTESATLKIQRVNFTQLFERVTLISAQSSLFGRKSYTSLTAVPAVSNLIALPANVRVTQVIISGLLSADNVINCPCTASLSVGDTAAPATYFGPLSVYDGINLPFTYAGVAVTYVGATNITATVSGVPGAGVGAAISGYVDANVAFDANPQYQISGQAAATVFNTALANTATFYVINGSVLMLSDQNAAQLVNTVVKEAESFMFSPGPPAIWGH